MRIAGVAVVSLALAAAAPAAPGTLPGRCSASGDVCFGLQKRSGVLVLQLVTAAKYFSSYRLCVTRPAGARSCKSYPMKPAARGTYASSVPLSSFGPLRDGRYRASWGQYGSLAFTVTVAVS
jgi:hypothetical protein